MASRKTRQYRGQHPPLPPRCQQKRTGLCKHQWGAHSGVNGKQQTPNNLRNLPPSLPALLPTCFAVAFSMLQTTSFSSSSATRATSGLVDPSCECAPPAVDLRRQQRGQRTREGNVRGGGRLGILDGVKRCPESTWRLLCERFRSQTGARFLCAKSPRREAGGGMCTTMFVPGVTKETSNMT